MTDCPTNNETPAAPTDARTVPMHHELGAMIHADAIESLRLAENELGIFISQSLSLKSLLKKQVDVTAPVPDWLQ